MKCSEVGFQKEISAKKGDLLAYVLKMNGVPLKFECNFRCECATCVIRTPDVNDFLEILTKIRLYSDEKNLILEKQLGARFLFNKKKININLDLFFMSEIS